LIKLDSIEENVKEILSWFLYQDYSSKTISKNGKITVYKVGDNIVRVDIKIK